MTTPHHTQQFDGEFFCSFFIYLTNVLYIYRLRVHPLGPNRPFTFDRNVDDFGWHTGEDGKHHFTLFIENGRVQDEPGRDFKKGLREIAKIHKGTFRLTANQHLLVSDVATASPMYVLFLKASIYTSSLLMIIIGRLRIEN
jgi:hypothetical protein